MKKKKTVVKIKKKIKKIKFYIFLNNTKKKYNSLIK